MAATRSNQLIVSLIVACAMFMQNLDCKAKTHTPDQNVAATAASDNVLAVERDTA